MTARNKFFPLDKIAARLNMGQPIKKVLKLKMFSRILTFSHRKKFSEKPIKKAEGALKKFPRFASAHCINMKCSYSNCTLHTAFWTKGIFNGGSR